MLLAATVGTRGITRVFPRHLPCHLFRMQSSTFPRVSRRNFDDEIVEDSEPEREALRQTQKQERKKRKLVQLARSASPAKVVFISDGSAPPSPATAPSPPKVIDISDSSANISVNQNVISVNQNVISLNSSAAGTNPESNAPHIVEVDSAGPSNLLQDSGHSDEEIVPTLDLARFAFANPRALQSRNSASTLASASSSDSRAKPPAKRAARGSSNGLAGQFSDTELKKLVKCVSCDIAWTARKSAAQKLVHIRSCGKKNGFTDDTMRHLIRKELDSMPAEPGPSNRNGKAPLVPTERTTLLEDVVRDAAPKRKGKRKPAADILKSVSETRENILGRARQVLGSGHSSDGENFVPQTQAITGDAHATAQPCATQAFGSSRLGQQQGYKPLFHGDEDSDDEEPNLPPATQAFAPSKLGARITSLGWGYESESEDDVPGPPQASRNPFDPPLFTASSRKEASPKSSPKPRKTKSRDKPILDGGSAKSPKSKRRIEAPAGGNESPRPISPTKRTRKKVDDPYDERWELGLKEKIVQDRDLHLRILRYEPIKFDIFLTLATEEEIIGSRLRGKLRAFLDKQAINFYGGEVTKRRRR
ncbi:hypothetical protein C8R47DRAFT_1196572 [Mycena vitilis]|nr:hypothetical protein C8R47DRAFT_1196572 [Mycena vitilis]